jgi:carbon monoxide dehydrogenase subunit G
MGLLHATIHVDAPPDRAFDAFADADGLAKWFPGARAVSETTGPLDRLGTTYTLEFAGPIRAHCQVIAVNRPDLHERTFHRRPIGIRGRARMRFEADQGGTKIALDGEYSLPAGPLGRALDKLLPGAGDRGARAELAHFKAFLEQTEPLATSTSR